MVPKKAPCNSLFSIASIKGVLQGSSHGYMEDVFMTKQNRRTLEKHIDCLDSFILPYSTEPYLCRKSLLVLRYRYLARAHVRSLQKLEP